MNLGLGVKVDTVPYPTYTIKGAGRFLGTRCSGMVAIRILRDVNTSSPLIVLCNVVWLVLSEISFVQELLGVPRPPQEVTQSGKHFKNYYSVTREFELALEDGSDIWFRRRGRLLHETYALSPRARIISGPSFRTGAESDNTLVLPRSMSY
eukprot:9482820-Pyramimonas_sp.AAC.3